MTVGAARVIDETGEVALDSSVDVPSRLEAHYVEIGIVGVISRPFGEAGLLGGLIDDFATILLDDAALLHPIHDHKAPAFALLTLRAALGILALPDASIATIRAGIAVPVWVLIALALIANALRHDHAVETTFIASHGTVLARRFALANLIARRVLLGTVGGVILEAVDVRVHGRLGVYILLKVTGETEFDLPEFLDRPRDHIATFFTIAIGAGTRSRSCSHIGVRIVEEAVKILFRLRDGCALHTEQEPVEPSAYVVVVFLLLLLPLEPLQLATLRLAHLLDHGVSLGLNFGLEGALGVQLGQLVGVVLVTEQGELVEATARGDARDVISDGTVEASL